MLPRTDGAVRYWIKSDDIRHEQWDIPVGLQADVWQHVTVVYDGEYMRFYINAVEKDSYPKTGNMNTNDEPVYIGLDGWNQSHHYRGIIDEVKLFDYALTPSAISDEYKSNCCIGETGNVDCSAIEEPDISDIVRLIDYLYLSHDPLCCYGEANVDASGAVPGNEEPDISDITFLIDHLYLSHKALKPCP